MKSFGPRCLLYFPVKRVAESVLDGFGLIIIIYGIAIM